MHKDKRRDLKIYSYDETIGEWTVAFDCIVHPDENFVEGKQPLFIIWPGGLDSVVDSVSGDTVAVAVRSGGGGGGGVSLNSCYGTPQAPEVLY